MANVDSYYGFKPVGKVGGNPNNGAMSEYAIKTDYATAMYQGDLVIFASGYINIGAAATAGNMVMGGLKYDDSTTNQPTFKNHFNGTALSTTTGVVFLYDDPYQVYEAQGDSATATTQAIIGTYCDHVKTHGGNSTTGISGDEIDVSDTATTLSGVKILGLVQSPSNSHAAHADLRCFIAECAHVN